MGKGLPRSTRRAAPGSAALVRTRYSLDALALSIDGATGVGWGTAVIGGLPEGNLYIAAAVAYVQITEADAGITATFDGDFGIGTTPATDATITGADVDIIPSTALGAATASVSPVVRGASSGGAMGTILNNTDGSLELNFNILIDDASISADNAVATVNGYVDVLLAVLGDD